MVSSNNKNNEYFVERIELFVENRSQVKYLRKYLKESYEIIGSVGKINGINGSFEGFEFGSYFLER